MINRSTLLATALTGASFVALSVIAAGPAGAATNRQVNMAGNLSAAGSGSTAVSYDPALAPLGARVSVDVVGGDDEGPTQVTVDVAGLLPDRGYVAQAHVNPCGATAADAGGPFRSTAAPAAGTSEPSTETAAAENEVRLDLQTDGDGAGHAETDVPFSLAAGMPRSVVIHDGSATGSGDTGVACITLSGR